MINRSGRFSLASLGLLLLLAASVMTVVGSLGPGHVPDADVAPGQNILPAPPPFN